ncbi:MAG: amidohydrolase family protein [Planctomycetaceae bacterium]
MKKRLELASLLLLIAGFFCSAQSFAQTSEHIEGLHENRPSVYALVGAKVVVAADRTLDKATIVIRNGRIASVGGKIPAGAHVIDLSGKTIYPGFIDSFSETDRPDTDPTGSPYWNSNVTPQVRVRDFYKPNSSKSKAYRSAGFVARLIAPRGRIVKGQSAIVQTNDEPAKHAVIADGGLHLRLTVSRRRGSGGSSYPNSPMGAYTLSRQALYDAEWYKLAWKAVKTDKSIALPENNDALKAIAPYLASELPVVIDTSNELYALRADRFAREFGLNAVINGSGNEYRRLDDVRATGRTIIVPLNFPKPPNVATAESATNVSLESLMHWDIAPENPARLVKGGVPIVLTANGLKRKSDFLKQLRKAVKRGLPKTDALQALTTRPAETFGVSDLLGSIEPGKLGSLVVTDGDLFEPKTKVVETWVAGERYEHDAAPERDTVGEWEMTIAAGEGQPAKLLLHVEDESTASVRVPEGDKKKARKLSRVGLKDVQLSGTFLGNDFGVEGVVRFSAVLEEESKSAVGHVVWPDESSSNLILTRTEPVANNTDSSEVDKDKTKDDKKNLPSSFAVNYPLGAYGRSDQPMQQTVLFRNATVWTSGPDGVIENGSVLVHNGKIAAVGRNITAPEGAKVVDVNGQHISPGIIDCHSHMATDGGVNESGQAITAEVRIGDFIDSDDITIYRQLAGGVTSSNILHGSANPIGGQNQVIKLRWGLNPEAMKFKGAPEGIKFALGENVKQSNWSNPTGRYPQTRMGVEQLFRDEFQTAAEYRKRWDEWKTNRSGMPPRYDLELEAISEILAGTRWVHCHSYRQDEILALIRVLDDHDVTIGTFQHILEGYKVADAMKKHGAMGSAFSDWWAYKFEVFDAIPHGGALMHEQGVVVSFNSDDAELATHLNQEAAKAVKYGGVAPAEALNFVTLNPAKQLRIDQHVGSLEVGKDADLVVWTASPLSNFARAEQTWVDGRKYFDRTEDARHRDSIRRMRATLVQKILMSGEKMREPGVGDGDPAMLWPREDLFCGHGSHDHDHDH